MIRLGILGASEIAPKSIILPASKISNVKIQAIAARDINRAIVFANKYKIPLAYGNYYDLLNNPEIDAVYIGLANHVHKKWIIEAAKSGKHILVEKPICLSMDELNEILSEVKNSGVNILEGIMIDHHPWIRYLEEIVKSNKYGKLNKTKTHISYQLFKDDSYRFKKECGGSVFWDESFLWSHLLQHVGVIELDKIEAQIKFNEPNGIDVEFQSNIQMVNGLKSEALFSYQRPFEFTHWLYFDKMEIKLRNFIRPLFGNVPVIIHISNQSGFTKEVKIEYEDCFKNQLEFFCEMLQGKKNNRPISEITERIEFQDRIYSKAMEMHNGKLQNKNIE